MSFKDLKESNELYISHERMLELQHFCRQVPEWEEELKDISEVQAARWIRDWWPDNMNKNWADPTYAVAVRRQWLTTRIDQVYDTIDMVVKRFAEDKDESYSYRQILMKGIIEGKGRNKIPELDEICSEYMYRKMYRYFFWLLDKRRD